MVAQRYGFNFNRQNSGVSAAITTDMSTIFLWGTSEDATPEVYPLNTLVLVNSSDSVALAAMGTGALYVAMGLINAQLAGLNRAARVVVNRVSKGATPEEHMANLVGSLASATGLYASLRAGPELGIIPRLFVCADARTGEFTRASANPLVSRTVKVGGNTGTAGLTLASPAYGAGIKAGLYRVRCKTAAAGGGVFSVVDPDGLVLDDATVGTAFAGPVRFTIPAPTGTGKVDFAVGDGFDITVVIAPGIASANAICAALPAVLNATLAHAIVDGPGTTKQDALDWRETIASDRLILVDAWVTPATAADGTYVGGAPAVAGIGVAVDAQTRGNQGVPSQSFANQQVQGIKALKRYDSFSLNDGANDGQELLSANIGIIQRGEAGVESAASSSGFNLICFDNAGTDEEWRFHNVTRMRDYQHLNLQKMWRARIGKNNITVKAVQAVENDAVQFLGLLKSDEHIIDFRVGIDGKVNTPATIRAGNLRVYFKSEESSPLLLITADSYRYPDSLNTLIQAIAGETNTILSTAS